MPDALPIDHVRLRGMLDWFSATVDCVDTGFLADDQILNQPALPSRLGRTRTGGVDLNKPPRHENRTSGLLEVGREGVEPPQLSRRFYRPLGVV